MIVRDGTLIVPHENILLGITRRHLITLARQLDIPAEERAVSVAELLAAEEAILCSTVKGVLPITRVGDKKVGGGGAGAITKKLMRAWSEYTKNAPDSSVGVGALSNLVVWITPPYRCSR